MLIKNLIQEDFLHKAESNNAYNKNKSNYLH